MNKKKAESIIKEIIISLGNRGGFDGWWDDIDEDIQEDIKEELVKIVMEKVQLALISRQNKAINQLSQRVKELEAK